MAGYDCGPLCVERAVQRTGYADYWELRRRNVLPRETQNYVPAILAMAIIAKDPAAYGIPLVDQDPELEFDTIRLTAPTHLALLADAADVPASDLRDLNPSVLKNVAPAGAEVRIPAGKGPAVLAALETCPRTNAPPGACIASLRATLCRCSPTAMARRPPRCWRPIAPWVPAGSTVRAPASWC